MNKDKESRDKQLYSVEGKIAEGTYASIYVAKDKKSGHRVALKVISDGFPDEHAENEIRLLQLAKHPHVVPYISSIKRNTWIIALELARCDLTSIYTRNEIPENMLARIFHDVVSALQFLHSIQILHRDVKASNLLVTNEGVIQLTDFGISAKLHGEGETALMGSPYWIAPEVILVSALFKPYGLPADMWSLGITIMEVGDGAIPRGNLPEKTVLSEITRLPPPRFAKRKPSGELQSFLNALLNKDPAVRPTAAQSIAVPWFSSAASREELKAYFDSVIVNSPAAALAASSSGEDMDVLNRKKLSGRFENVLKGKGRDRRDDKSDSRSSAAGARDSPQRNRPAPLPLDTDQFGKDENGNLFLKKATLDQAIDFIISQPQEMNFLSVFFITHRSFTTSERLLSSLKQRFEAEAGKEGMQNRIRICILLKHWVANFWDDFDEQFIVRFTDVIKNVIQPVIASSANIVLQLIEKKKQAPPPKQTETPRRVNLALAQWTPDTITTVAPVEVAKQLTMMEQEIFVSLKSNEFLGRGWLRADKDILAPNIGQTIRRFNKISNWWSTEILRQPTNALRVAYIEWLLRLASVRTLAGLVSPQHQEFHLLQNYSSLLQITAALQSTPVWRLNETWDALSAKDKKAFEFLKSVVSSGQNWAQQREALLQKPPPSIPFVGMYLTELVFLEESGATVEGEVINFEKPRKVASIIQVRTARIELLRNCAQEIQLLQQTRYNFEVLDFVRSYFSAVEPLDESRRFEKSFGIMPRPVPVRQSSAPDVTTVPKIPTSGSTSPPVSPGRPNSVRDPSRATVASPRRNARPDEESIKAAILESTGDADARTHKAYGTMQKAMAHFLKARGASSVTITDQTKLVYDSVTKVAFDTFEMNGRVHVLAWRLVATKSDVAHCKRLAAAYATHSGNGLAVPLLVCLQLESDDVKELADAYDICLVVYEVCLS